MKNKYESKLTQPKESLNEKLKEKNIKKIIKEDTQEKTKDVLELKERQDEKTKAVFSFFKGKLNELDIKDEITLTEPEVRETSNERNTIITIKQNKKDTRVLSGIIITIDKNGRFNVKINPNEKYESHYYFGENLLLTDTLKQRETIREFFKEGKVKENTLFKKKETIPNAEKFTVEDRVDQDELKKSKYPSFTQKDYEEASAKDQHWQYMKKIAA